MGKRKRDPRAWACALLVRDENRLTKGDQNYIRILGLQIYNNYYALLLNANPLLGVARSGSYCGSCRRFFRMVQFLAIDLLDYESQDRALPRK